MDNVEGPETGKTELSQMQCFDPKPALLRAYMARLSHSTNICCKTCFTLPVYSQAK